MNFFFVNIILLFEKIRLDSAIDYNNIIGTYESLGEYGKAVEYYERALRIVIPFWGNNHPNTKIFRDNLESARKKV